MKAVEIRPKYDIAWPLETKHCHHGMPLSNGVLGALIWFDDERTVRLTINRADYWDHRGGTIWTEACNYANLKELLQNGDFEGARSLFPSTVLNGKEKRPTRLALGRVDLTLAAGARIEAAALHLREGEASIRCLVNGEVQTIRLTVAHEAPVLLISANAILIEEVRCRPADQFEQVKAYNGLFGIPPHRPIERPDVSGWVQELPEDPACAVLAGRSGGGVCASALANGGDAFFTAELGSRADNEDACIGTANGCNIRIAVEFGRSADEAIRAAERHLERLKPLNYGEAAADTRDHWRRLWRKAADIELPDPDIAEMYYLGIYRMLGNSMPGRIAPTLQGPWAEEYRHPPWGSDYHFNINVQECLWPACAANLPESMEPLLAMIARWKPKLAENARRFAGISDGYMLGHSVTDRGDPVGGMWTGTIDQANTSWVAQLMWQYASYTGDERYLRDEAYPFMRGALNTFRAMMEEDGDAYALLVSVSPEYGGSGPEALGRNSTFFLVNVHFLCEKLPELTERFGPDPEYAAVVRDISRRLPPYTAGPRQFQEFGRKPGLELCLWEGQPLAESHRHHSHLAGIYPFDTLDQEDPGQRELIENSYRSWVDKGMGRWAGWSMPWASILHNRLGRPDMALLTLRLLKDAFMMPGGATRHNASYDGFCQFTGGETMQAEASIAAAAAVLEMFVQCVRGTVRVFAGVAPRFRDASFSGIRTEGAFLLSGVKAGGAVRSVTVFGERDGTLRLANPFAGRTAEIRRDERETAIAEEAVIVLRLRAGETAVLTEAAGSREGTISTEGD
ncbi:glycosyl hydrolase family 95 catalytic domain-containing protein [Cohnella zeiphila]|uniref:Glycosyl hydrolase family 95 catalytic domain-containing protein n=1 Tax=Cohnella zeiphila TaxID=2761120 RepID=A0A7X0SVL2_9BACL|nr:hypothetical protein [Cohnella zeiphila]MBB6735720.1 hypothetical protein [Cohnella zeiphila]